MLLASALGTVGALPSCAHATTLPTAVAPAQPTCPPAAEVQAVLAQIRPSGALPAYFAGGDGAAGNGLIEPYFANQAFGLLLSAREPGADVLYAAHRWIDWYLAHATAAMPGGPATGAIYTYRIDGAGEVSTGQRDSTDAYAASFLRLARRYAATLPPGDAEYFAQDRGPALRTIAQVALATRDPATGLTRASPEEEAEFAMDNPEVWAGLGDYEALTGDHQFASSRDGIARGIRARLVIPTGPHRGLLRMRAGEDPVLWRRYPELAANQLAAWLEFPRAADVRARLAKVAAGIAPAAADEFPLLWTQLPDLGPETDRALDDACQARIVRGARHWPGWNVSESAAYAYLRGVRGSAGVTVGPAPGPAAAVSADPPATRGADSAGRARTAGAGTRAAKSPQGQP